MDTTLLRGAYRETQAIRAGHLRVDDLHTIYYEEYGTPNAKPVVFLHGGPGGGCTPGQARFFDPDAYHIILFDQRGCGRSTPHACLERNTTWDLVADIEALRQHLNIDRWQVFGGSWGSTLALAYAQTHPERVTELILRGIFMLRKREIDWFYQDGASRIFPDAWEHFISRIPPEERGDLLHAYHRRLTSEDTDQRLQAAKAWSGWEGCTSSLQPNMRLATSMNNDHFALAFARIECHYFVNRGFFADDNQLFDNLHRMRHIPTTIVQGRYDVVCPMETAFALHKAFPEARFVVANEAGHSAFEPQIQHHLIEATDRHRTN